MFSKKLSYDTHMLYLQDLLEIHPLAKSESFGVQKIYLELLLMRTEINIEYRQGFRFLVQYLHFRCHVNQSYLLKCDCPA